MSLYSVYYVAGHTSAAELHDIIHDRNIVKDMLNSSGESATSHLEAFHSLINHYAPKMLYYRSRAMKSRLVLLDIVM